MPWDRSHRAALFASIRQPRATNLWICTRANRNRTSRAERAAGPIRYAFTTLPLDPFDSKERTMQRHAFTRRALLLALSSLPVAATAAPTCADLQAFLADKTAGELVCFHSDDLRTM